MENSYGIGVANRYALFLDDESDPLETLSLKEKEIDSRKKSKVAEKENKAKIEPLPKGKPAPVVKKTPNSINKVSDIKRDESKSVNQRSFGEGKVERNFNKSNNDNREEWNNKRNREDRPFNGPSENRDRDDRPRKEGDFENRNRDRGERRDARDGRAIGNKPGGPRGPRRTFDDKRGKREFDRQSGSDKTSHGYRGVKPVDKREGAGPHNWGSHKDIIEEVDRPNDADNSWGEENKVETVETEKKEETETEAIPQEEEPKELTLDEWKAQRAGRAKPQYNIRKAGEGEDPSQWKKMFELKKKEKEEESEDEEYDVSEYPQRVGRQKHLLEIDIQFNDSRRPGGGGRGRGQRSGQRGGRVNRGGRGGEPGRDVERRFRSDDLNRSSGEERIVADNRQAPKVDDERDFPSLG